MSQQVDGFLKEVKCNKFTCSDLMQVWEIRKYIKPTHIGAFFCGIKSEDLSCKEVYNKKLIRLFIWSCIGNLGEETDQGAP